MPATLTLHPPGSALHDALLPRLAAALEAGESVWYLVPDARARSARLRAVAQRVSVLEPPVGTPGDFAARVLRRAGEPAAPRPDPALGWLLTRRALAAAFAGLPAGEGVARLAGAALRELEDDGWTGDALARLAAAADPEAAHARLARAWRTVAAQCPERDTGHALRRVLDAGRVAEYAPRLLLVEGGAVAGELAARLLRALVDATLARGGEVVAACPDLPAGRGRHARGLALLRRWLGTDGVAVAAADAALPPGVARLGARLFRPASPDDGLPAIPPGDVVRLHAPDDDGVADAVAREIRALLAAASDPGALLDGGVAVVCPGASDRDRVARALARLEIPAAREPRASLAATAGGRWLLALLRLLGEGEDAPVSAATALLVSDAWGYPARAQDAVARRLAVRGAARAGDVPALLPTRSRARLARVLAAAGELRACGTSAECARVVRAVLPAPTARGAGDALRPLRAAWRRHAHTHAAEYAAPLRRFDALLDVLSEAARRAGAEPDSAEWLADLRALLDRAEVRLGPAPARGVRLEGPGRTEPAAHVFVVGLVEGRFPAAPRRQPFLPDALRDALAGAELGPRAVADRADEEREAFLLACTAARTRLYLCHPRTDADGREVLPSFWLDDVAAALGAPLPQRGRPRAEVVPRLERAWGPAELRAAVAAALRDEGADNDARLAVRRAHDDLGRGPAPPFPTWRVAPLGEAERGWLAARAERVSFSQLDRFGHCSFRHFVDARLEPGGVALPVFDAGMRGNRVHEWLWAVGAADGGWDDPAAVLAALFAQPEPDDTPPSVFAGAGSRAALEQWRRRVVAWATGEAARIRAGAFRPAHHELAFGRRHDGPRDPASRPEPLELTVGGARLRLGGAVDRVDRWTDGDGVRWGIALDYKTGRVDDRTPAMEEGRDLQLPLYLHVLESFGIRPAGALYLSVRDGGIAGVVRAELADAVGPLPSTVHVADDAAWTALRARADAEAARLHTEMREGRLRVWPRDGDCEFCDHQGICRVELRRAREDVHA